MIRTTYDFVELRSSGGGIVERRSSSGGVVECRIVLAELSLTSRRLASTEYSKVVSVRVSMGGMVQGGIPG